MEKVSLCNKNSCVTVYGETAAFINGVLMLVAVVALAGAIAKAIKA